METVIRVVVIYLVILVGLRLLGKREFSQLSPLELVTLLLIPELVSQSLVREDYSITNAIVAVTTLLSLVFINSLIMYKSKRVEDLVEGTPSLLVQHGKFIADNMNKERISPEEIFTEMHHAGLYQLSQVKWAVLECDGKISIVPEEQQGKSTRGAKEETL